MTFKQVVESYTFYEQDKRTFLLLRFRPGSKLVHLQPVLLLSAGTHGFLVLRTHCDKVNKLINQLAAGTQGTTSTKAHKNEQKR